ncbi:hypothetical protein NLG97_g698 [Lecanicillium saksenae]|uniref:Uncharacterized protein n=1 Tax=Lecanicillium saksenae TaxID=468837 RepID=A0ACC1RA01_9HYPO|nr:hypothetical protein NLG97_g698 [Lecanicillium saksenae]
MFNDSSLPFYIIFGVIFWILRHLEEITKCLYLWKSGALSPAQTMPSQVIDDVYSLGDLHEAATSLSEMIRHDGASSWPPRSNHNHDTWPTALQGYKLIYLELAKLLPSSPASLDDDTNRIVIDKFRCRFVNLLQQHVDLEAVLRLLKQAENEKNIMSGEIHNAFYCCIAWCRHAYRWGIVPVVKVAQAEKIVDLPTELIEPWTYLQRYFGCTSQSSNVMSGLVLNFDTEGRHIFKANCGLSSHIISAEEDFARIFRDIEESALPIYRDMVRVVIAFSDGNKRACLEHLARIQIQLRPLLSIYYDRMHDQKIPRSAWLSHVQGFLAWGTGYKDKETGEFVKFDGLSGNQILLFQALDAFLGMDSYLSAENLEQNVPMRQREFCTMLRKHSVRGRLSELSAEDDATEILEGFDKIVKRLRVFRSAHRTRSLGYLRQPAPERYPMTAGKSMLHADLDQSLHSLDQFMVTRLNETV